ncbi:MAG: hypothetical protein PF448_09670 [Bacteroidales bacterium]|jgi:hypothetical protein|nr:hypothetical protein [Bacteroidales bacterium]
MNELMPKAKAMPFYINTKRSTPIAKAVESHGSPSRIKELDAQEK